MDEWKEWFWEERGRCGAGNATRRVIWPYLSLYAPPSSNVRGRLLGAKYWQSTGSSLTVRYL